MTENTFRVNMRIYVEQRNSGGLQVEQSFSVTASDFLDLCKILAQFQDLAKKIEQESTTGKIAAGYK